MSLDADGADRRRARGPSPNNVAVNGQPSVNVQLLNHSFGERELRNQVLFDVQLRLMPGTIVIMTGPSGSGKTTLLTLIGGLRTVQDGKVHVLGHVLNGMSQRQLVQVRREIGFIFQGHNLFESLTAAQNVGLGLKLRRDRTAADKHTVVELLTRLGLGDRVDYKPGTLSGGQKQRVAVARALINRPRLILADEPTAALDRQSGRDVVELLKEFAVTHGSTIMIVTHDSRIVDVADRIVNFVDGRIISDVVVEESAQICEYLLKCEVFAGLPSASLTEVADKMVKETCSGGSVIVRQGDEADKFYLIRSGRVDVFDGVDASAERINTMSEGDFFGEVALLTGERRSATVIATEDVVLYSLSKPEFEAVMHRSDTFKQRVRKALFQRQ